MARIKFLSDQVYDTGAPGQGPTFKAGQVVDETKIAKLLGMRSADEEFRAAWMRRWVNRGVAEFMTEEALEAVPSSGAGGSTETSPQGSETPKSDPAAHSAQQASVKA